MFLFVSLAMFSKIEAQSRKTDAKHCKIRTRGKTWTIYNTPDGCCNRRGYISFRSVSECQILCPLLNALRGCEFMCHWYLCNRNTNGDYDQCVTKCETMPHPLLPPVDKSGDREIDCAHGIYIYGIDQSVKGESNRVPLFCISESNSFR